MSSFAAAGPHRPPEDGHWNVLVIGAGVAGAAAALHCARSGLKTLLVEKQRFPRYKVCGGCLNGRAIHLLQQLGIGQKQLRQISSPVDTLQLHVRGRTSQVVLPETCAVARDVLDSVLTSALLEAGGVFLDGTIASVLPAESEHAPLGPSSRANSSMVPPRRVRLRPILPQEERDSTETVMETTNSLPQRQHPQPGLPPGTALGQEVEVTADLVLTCDGLGHPSLRQIPEVKSRIASRTRIGVGAIMPRTPADECYPPGTLQMAVSPFGYVGVVGVPGNQLNVAAAIDTTSLNARSRPIDVLRRIYESAGLPAPASLESAHFRGTCPLMRTTNIVALPRLLLLGDAAGYVEPFTGEGMAWALAAAQAVSLLATEAVNSGWSTALERQWTADIRRRLGKRQWLCRLLVGCLQIPWLQSPMLTASQLSPRMTQSIVKSINKS